MLLAAIYYRREKGCSSYDDVGVYCATVTSRVTVGSYSNYLFVGALTDVLEQLCNEVIVNCLVIKSKLIACQ
jgi:hypothetical protein